jgi:hypothetical protein
MKLLVETKKVRKTITVEEKVRTIVMSEREARLLSVIAGTYPYTDCWKNVSRYETLSEFTQAECVVMLDELHRFTLDR